MVHSFARALAIGSFNLIDIVTSINILVDLWIPLILSCILTLLCGWLHVRTLSPIGIVSSLTCLWQSNCCLQKVASVWSLFWAHWWVHSLLGLHGHLAAKDQLVTWDQYHIIDSVENILLRHGELRYIRNTGPSSAQATSSSQAGEWIKCMKCAIEQLALHVFLGVVWSTTRFRNHEYGITRGLSLLQSICRGQSKSAWGHHRQGTNHVPEFWRWC